MSVNQFDILSPLGHRSFEVVAEGVGASGDLLEDATDDGLLALFAKDVLVEFDEAGFAAVVDYYYSFDHVVVVVVVVWRY